MFVLELLVWEPLNRVHVTLSANGGFRHQGRLRGNRDIRHSAFQRDTNLCWHLHNFLADSGSDFSEVSKDHNTASKFMDSYRHTYNAESESPAINAAPKCTLALAS